MRDTAEFLFVVRKDGDTPWIALQAKDRGLNEALGEICLKLYRGTSLEDAKQLTRFLNSNIKSIQYVDMASSSQPLAGRVQNARPGSQT